MADGSIKDYTDYQQVVEKQYEQYEITGSRVIALCYKVISQSSIKKEDEVAMVFAGFVLLQDPEKAGIVDTINELKKLQVGLKIITGDNKNVAKSIGVSIDIANPMVSLVNKLKRLHIGAILHYI